MIASSLWKYKQRIKTQSFLLRQLFLKSVLGNKLTKPYDAIKTSIFNGTVRFSHCISMAFVRACFGKYKFI